MAFWIYSSETIPNPEYFGKGGYTPEWFVWCGVQLPILIAGEWTKLPARFDNLYVTRRRDWRDTSGVRDHISVSEFSQALKKRWGDRGVIVLDHEPGGKAEKEPLEKQARDVNFAFRMKIVEEYENAVREREVTGVGRTKPTPYEDECYTILGLTKPYSVEAMRAQRHPGEAVGEQIVAALERLEARKKSEAAQSALPSMPVMEKSSKPQSAHK